MLLEHRFMGQLLPQNIYFIAACNPYRLRSRPRAGNFDRDQRIFLVN
jgi:hypothetical protein